jgi:formylmethanofuran dehydrogenase subunit A
MIIDKGDLIVIKGVIERLEKEDNVYLELDVAKDIVREMKEEEIEIFDDNLYEYALDAYYSSLDY